MCIDDSGSISHVVNSIKNITNPGEVKTVVQTGNKITMTGSLLEDWKRY